jgi:hypothetical protein
VKHYGAAVHVKQRVPQNDAAEGICCHGAWSGVAGRSAVSREEQLSQCGLHTRQHLSKRGHVEATLLRLTLRSLQLDRIDRCGVDPRLQLAPNPGEAACEQEALSIGHI